MRLRLALVAAVALVGSAAALAPAPLVDCDGLLRMADGLCSHGADPIPLVDELTVDLPRDPVCVAPALPDLDPYTLAIYARAVDDVDRYSTKAPAIRNLVRQANGAIHDAAAATGTTAALKVHCTGGEITVLNMVLPTPLARDSFDTIVADLGANEGFQDSAIKYWVYYDDTGACACGGTGHFIGDDTPTPANLNMGIVPLGGMYAVTFGYDSMRIMLHELMHTMGAVQTSAPHTTGAAHCTDGDIMCYNDGGPTALPQTTPCGSGATSTRVDCGYDDYFHANPDPGSYLSTHWNLGSRANRFLRFEDAPPRLP